VVVRRLVDRGGRAVALRRSGPVRIGRGESECAPRGDAGLAPRPWYCGAVQRWRGVLGRELTTSCAYSDAMSDVHTEVRQAILAELIDLAARHAAQHQELHQTAVQAHRDEMAQLALSNQNAWLEVTRVLRL